MKLVWFEAKGNTLYNRSTIIGSLHSNIQHIINTAVFSVNLFYLAFNPSLNIKCFILYVNTDSFIGSSRSNKVNVYLPSDILRDCPFIPSHSQDAVLVITGRAFTMRN